MMKNPIFDSIMRGFAKDTSIGKGLMSIITNPSLNWVTKNSDQSLYEDNNNSQFQDPTVDNRETQYVEPQQDRQIEQLPEGKVIGADDKYPVEASMPRRGESNLPSSSPDRYIEQQGKGAGDLPSSSPDRYIDQPIKKDKYPITANKNGSITSDTKFMDFIGEWEGGHKGGFGSLGYYNKESFPSLGRYHMTKDNARRVAEKLGFNYRDVRNKSPKLKSALSSKAGIKAQHEVFEKHYAKPAISRAKRLGITDPKVIKFMIDTNLNGGLQSVLKRAKRKGGYTLKNLYRAREDRYRSLARSSKYSHNLKGWLNRNNALYKTLS